MIVLDTNVVSELMRPAPSTKVTAWVRRQRPGALVTTAITVAEIRFGLARLPVGRRSRRLHQVADEVLAGFPAQVLSFDGAATIIYGDMAATRERAGQPADALDVQIAAICRLHEASLATRNGKDFAHTGVDVVDPWTD